MANGSVQPENVRVANRLSLLRSVLESEEFSRADAAHWTQLSVPTVTSIFQEFSELGIIQSVGFSTNRGGRPAEVFQPRRDARQVLAADLSGRVAEAGKLDLCGELLSLEAGPVISPSTAKAVLEWLCDLVSLSDDRLHYIAIAAPGVIDSSTGRVRLAPSLGWDDFPLASVLEEKTGLRVVIENDVNALTLAQLDLRDADSVRHLIYLLVTSGGIGAGIVVNRELYRGSRAAAGEVGFSLLGLQDQPQKIEFGTAGPLEAALVKEVCAALDAQGRLSVNSPAAERSFERFLAGIQFLVHNLACALDPDLFLIDWSPDEEGVLAREIGKRWLGPDPIRVEAVRRSSGSALKGVSRLALDAIAAEIALGSRSP